MAKRYIEEVLATPIEKVLFNLGKGISAVQMELDRNSLATQIMIENTPELKGKGLEATWYQIPEVDFELKISMHIVEKKKGNIREKSIFISPMNASYKNSLNYEVAGSSVLRLRIVPVPPPFNYPEEEG
ncbi:hypothetical protein [Persephonella sp.]